MKTRTTVRALVPSLAIGAAVLGLCLALPPAAFAVVERGSVLPNAPTVCDSVQLVVEGALSSSCYTLGGFQVGAPVPLPTMGPIPTYGIDARIYVKSPEPGTPCPTVIVPYRLTSALGRLPFGNYWVDAKEYVLPFPADSAAPIDSSETRFTFFVGYADSCGAGESCVLLGFAPTGADLPPLGGCTASVNPGERACFDVTLENQVPVGGLQTEVAVPLPAFAASASTGDPLVPVSVTPALRAAGFQAGWAADGTTAKIVLYSTTGAVIAPGGGPILHVCYDVKPDAPEGSYALRFGNSLVSTPEGAALPFCPTFAIVSGRICVGIPGCDLNGDGVDDIRDIVHLVRCILATPPDTCADSLQARADCNGDASVDVRDIICCVRNALARDFGWTTDPAFGGTPPGAARIGFEGAAGWSDALEGRAEIAITPGASFGGLQFVLDPGRTARVRDIALDDPSGSYALQWGPGDADGSARVMIYDQGTVALRARARDPGEAGSAAGTRVVVTFDPVAGAAGAGTMAIHSFRGADFDGSSLGVQADVTSLALPPSPVAAAPAILPARPNPFVAETEIAFTVARAGRASVRLFDVAGRLVRTLYDGPATAGVHHLRWDGRDDRGRSAGVGIYFAHLAADGKVRTERILRLR